MVVEVVRFDTDHGLEIGGTQFVVDDERAQDPESRRVADRPLHREILRERQPAILGKRRVLALVVSYSMAGFARARAGSRRRVRVYATGAVARCRRGASVLEHGVSGALGSASGIPRCRVPSRAIRRFRTDSQPPPTNAVARPSSSTRRPGSRPVPSATGGTHSSSGGDSFSIDLRGLATAPSVQTVQRARELTHHLHRQRLEAVARKGSILWEDYDEFLAQAETEIDADAFHETGLARFRAFDLQFFLTSHRYYFFSEDLDVVSPAELCCHTLLIDDDSRHCSYCLLLLSHIDVDGEDLREHAAKYGLEGEIDALLRYLETHGEVDDDQLPVWDEFQELAADYEVPLPQ